MKYEKCTYQKNYFTKTTKHENWLLPSMPSLNQLIQYKNADIVSRYQRDFPFAKMTGDVALIELMKFIWLCQTHKQERLENLGNESLQFTCVMHTEMLDIDNMWHTFLLFSRDYHAFCTRYLNGEFFHHEPTRNASTGVMKEQYELELSRYLSYIYDKLGEETVVNWFRDLL